MLKCGKTAPLERVQGISVAMHSFHTTLKILWYFWNEVTGNVSKDWCDTSSRISYTNTTTPFEKTYVAEVNWFRSHWTFSHDHVKPFVLGRRQCVCKSDICTNMCQCMPFFHVLCRYILILHTALAFFHSLVSIYCCEWMCTRKITFVLKCKCETAARTVCFLKP